jgi:hypothetical protein
MLHGELGAHAQGPARAHLACCAACRERVAAARRDQDEIDALLRHLDHPPPHLDAAAIARSAPARRSAPLRRAAAVLLALGAAGGAWAAVGSPVPDWFDAWRGRGGAPLPAEPPAAAAPEPATGGIAVPAGAGLVLDFALARTGQVHVSLTEGSEVTVRTLAGPASYTSDPDRRILVESDAAQPAFAVGIPRGATRVEIRAAGRRVFLKEGVRVTTDAPADEDGGYLIPLAAF